MALIIEELVEVCRPPVIAIVQARNATGIILHGITIRERNGVFWASPGAAARVDHRGRQMRDRAGILLWNPVISFVNQEIRDRFSAEVLAALRVYNPDFFK